MNEEKEFDKLIIDDTEYETFFSPKFNKQKKFTINNPKKVTAFIPGIIREIYVKVGDKVNKGDKLLVLEAMKMLNVLNSTEVGTVKEILINSGNQVVKNQLLIEIE